MNSARDEPIGELRYRSILETMSEGVVVQDATGAIEAWNARALELLGLTADELRRLVVRTDGWRVVREDGSPFPPEEYPMAVTAATGQPRRDVVVGIQRPDGREVWLAVNSSAMREGDRLTGVVCTFTDITSRRQAELDVADRAELASQLQQAQKMEAVGQLAGGIAHDFNNLLTAISCNVELLLDEIEPVDPRHDDVLQIREAAARAATLTQQLLAFSRRQVLQPKPLDLNTTVVNMERLLRRVISTDARLRTALHPALPRVFADAGQMEQVVMNLVLNARDAMPDGGTIDVRTAPVSFRAALQHRFGVIPPGQYVALSVRDAGVGMAPEVLDRLFEPFFTTKVQGKGTGLGMAMVHGIVLQSNGQITVDTTPGEGAEFTIYLPSHRADSVPVAPPPPREVAPPVGRTVLVVDDEPAVRDVTMRAIVRAGYRVIGAAGGADALGLLEREREPSSVLVLTDIMMPGMNGHELAAHVAARHPGVRVVFMSGFSPEEMARQGVAGPSRRLLNKPFTLPALTAFVEAAFGADSADSAVI